MPWGGVASVGHRDGVRQDGAHDHSGTSEHRAATEPDATESGRSRPPLFTARTDRVTGVIRARGHLDGFAAEALCRVARGLHDLGHRDVVVQLGATTIDDEAAAVLAERARPWDSGSLRLLR